MINLKDNSKLVKCIGVNEKNLSYPEFHRLFTAKCYEEGEILQVVVTPTFAAAIVIRRN